MKLLKRFLMLVFFSNILLYYGLKYTIGNKNRISTTRTFINTSHINLNFDILKDKEDNNDSKNILEKNAVAKEDVNSFLDSRNNVQGKVNVYYYVDICHDYDTYSLLWNTLFPKYPNNTQLIDNFADPAFVSKGGQSRRLIAFLKPDQTGFYKFKLNCVMGCEMILIHSDKYRQDVLYDKFLLRFGIFKSDIKEKLKVQKITDQVSKESSTVSLNSGKKYLVDITHVLPHFGYLNLRWRNEKDANFSTIPNNLLFSLHPAQRKPMLSRLPNIQYSLKESEISKSIREDARNDFHKLSLASGPQNLKEFDYNPDYIPKAFPKDSGVAFVLVDQIYPPQASLEHSDKRKEAYYKLFIDKERAYEVATFYMKLLDRKDFNITTYKPKALFRFSSYALKRIVHIEENKDTKQGKRYFVEVDVSKIGDDTKLYRSSGWIFIKKETGEIFRPLGYQWNPKEKIYLLTPVKNQARWVGYLIDSLNAVVERTSEKNIHLIIIDFESRDCNVEDFLKEAKFPYTLLREKGMFSKVIGLNRGVKTIKEEDSIVFVYDLHLEIPDFIFDQIRKHTFRKRTTYVPILLRLNCGEHPAYTQISRASIWQQFGYGMISIFKSDWIRIGGMNEERFGTKWGGEDWEFIDRVLIHKIEVIHHRIPGYYHIYHSTEGTWDGSKKF